MNEGLALLWSVLLLAYWIAIAVALINDGRDPTKTLAWLLVMFLLPILGLVLYFFLGRNWKKKTAKETWVAEVRQVAEPVLRGVSDRYAPVRDEAHEWAAERGFEKLLTTIETADGALPLPAYDVDILVDGEVKFATLEADLAAAKDTINIQYFIWERDELTARLTKVLLERLAAGVEVRMLNDFIGNIQYKKDEIEALRAAGAKIQYDVRDIGKINYRNHRKIVVIDGVLGYTGGINVGQEYIDGKPKYPAWRDTHVRFRGPLVSELQKLFAGRWFESVHENLFTERFFPAEYPETGTRVLGQVVATGVEDPWESARRAHEVAISSASSRIWLQSPYFVPTDALYQNLVNAALSGVDVRFMMTGWPDKKIAWYAAETYFEPLLRAGGRIFHYNAGFFHAKTMTVDGQLLSIGTMNMDIRSLELHKECMAWFYDEALTRQHEQVFLNDLEQCDEITVEQIESRTPVQVFRNHAARLASNLL